MEGDLAPQTAKNNLQLGLPTENLSRTSLDAPNMILRVFWKTLIQRDQEGLQEEEEEEEHPGRDDEEGLGYGVRVQQGVLV